MLTLLLAFTVALLTWAIALSAHWLGHIRWSGNLPASPWVLTASGLPLLAVGAYLYWRSRRLAGAETHPPAPASYELDEDSSLPAAVLRNMQIVAANAAFSRYFGIGRNAWDMVDIPFAAFVHPEDWKKFNSLTESPSADLASVKVRIRRVDGSSALTRTSARLIDYEGSGALLLELAPEPGPEAAVPSNDEQCRLIIDSIEQVVFQTDLKGRWVFLSPSWQELTGFPVGESLGKDFLGYVHPQEAERSAEKFQSLVSRRTGRCWYETRLLMVDAGFCWVEARVAPVLSHDEKVIGLAGTFTDITKRKSTEESLRASRRTLTTLLGNLPAMVSRSRNDRNWTMEFVSDGCFELTGYEAADLIDNLKLSYAELIHPDDRDYVWRNVQCRVAQDKAYELTYRITTATGAIKWVWERGRGVFSAGGDLLALEGFMTDITARKRTEDAARRDLFCDPLTGLASAAVFQDRLAYVHHHSKAAGYPFALLYIDLDNFKKVNGDHDRKFGDALLAETGRRLNAIQRKGNTVARIGSDEFAILVSDLNHPPRQRLVEPGRQDAAPAGKAPMPAIPDTELALRAVQIAERLQQDLAQPALIDGVEVTVTASVGIAISISAYEGPEKMLAEAAEAAHRAKFLGESRSTLADPALHAKALGRRHIESSLTSAFGSNAMRILYQPVVALDSWRVAWLEAIMYWQHPRRGLLDFDAFFGIAEDTGLLTPITRWLLRETSAQLTAWQRELADKMPDSLCITVRGKALADVNVVKEMSRVMRESQLAGRRWIIQVRDMADISNSPEAQEALLVLKRSGIRIAVSDDDKAPRGPLNVKTVVTDIWKVDVGLINKERNLALLRTTRGPDTNDRLLAVATGIQTGDALMRVIDAGFVYGQGPLFGEPVPAESVRSMILGGISRLADINTV